MGGLQFTHLAGWLGFQAVRNALLPGREPGFPPIVPRVLFTDPEVASVGIPEEEARARFGDRVRVRRLATEGIDRALAEGREEGFIQVVSDDKGRILGATVMAAHAGESIAEYILAMTRRFGLSELSRTVHPYPTWSTGVQQLASAEATDRFLSSTVGRIALRLSGL